MRKTYYSHYAAHAIRNYVESLENDHTDFPTIAEALNWESADKAFSKLTQTERDVVKALYRKDGPMQERVETVARETGFSAESVWTVCDRAMKLFAGIRGLI